MNEKKFSFGKNWNVFLQSLTDEKVNNAVKSLCNFLSVENLKSKSVLRVLVQFYYAQFSPMIFIIYIRDWMVKPFPMLPAL